MDPFKLFAEKFMARMLARAPISDGIAPVRTLLPRLNSKRVEILLRVLLVWAFEHHVIQIQVRDGRESSGARWDASSKKVVA